MVNFVNTVDVIGDEALMDLLLTRDITELYDSYVTILGSYSLMNCKLLTVVDVPNCTMINPYCFSNSSNLIKLVLRSNTMVTLSNISAFAQQTPFASGTGYIYVPKALIEEYKAATNWVTYADQFRAIEDWSHDSTTTGDISVTRKILDRGITGYYRNDQVTYIAEGVFRNSRSLTSVDFPLVTQIGNSAFYNCESLTTANFPSLTKLGFSVFNGCAALTALILRNTETVCTLAETGVFTRTPIASGTGYIYVPSALIDSYKVATNWVTYAAQFRAIEDYPDICG